MSTKAIREALEMIEESWPGRAILGPARAEVEAIERAAKDLDDNLVAQVFASNPEKVQAALDVMNSIARDDP